jgi:hypothetical protein
MPQFTRYAVNRLRLLDAVDDSRPPDVGVARFTSWLLCISSLPSSLARIQFPSIAGLRGRSLVSARVLEFLPKLYCLQSSMSENYPLLVAKRLRTSALNLPTMECFTEALDLIRRSLLALST